MVDIKSGDEVTVFYDSFGREIKEKGRLLYPVYTGASDDICWWVEIYTTGGVKKVEVYTETDIVEWNRDKYLKSKLCECGADRLGHPGHSQWCRSFQP